LAVNSNLEKVYRCIHVDAMLPACWRVKHWKDRHSTWRGKLAKI